MLISIRGEAVSVMAWLFYFLDRYIQYIVTYKNKVQYAVENE